jgi:hypothetical protein
MKRSALACVLVILCGAVAQAQLAVYDPAVTARNTITATLKEYLVELQHEQRRLIRRMSRRLSMFTDLRKYGVPDPPRWRTHDWEHPDVFLFARAYHAALNYGDTSGNAFLDISQPLLDAEAARGQLSPTAERTLRAQLATVNLTDAAVIAATNDTGQLRFNGRRELQALEALDRDVTDGSLEQSATAVLDKLSGASLIAARQRQARVQLLSAMVEQLLIEGKRARDTEAATLNSQLVTWRDARAANEAFVAGAGDALRVWRQP